MNSQQEQAKQGLLSSETTGTSRRKGCTRSSGPYHISCDPCRFRKKQCSRDLPCERCVRINEPNACVYSRKDASNNSIANRVGPAATSNGNLPYPSGARRGPKRRSVSGASLSQITDDTLYRDPNNYYSLNINGPNQMSNGNLQQQTRRPGRSHSVIDANVLSGNNGIKMHENNGSFISNSESVAKNAVKNSPAIPIPLSKSGRSLTAEFPSSLPSNFGAFARSPYAQSFNPFYLNRDSFSAELSQYPEIFSPQRTNSPHSLLIHESIPEPSEIDFTQLPESDLLNAIHYSTSNAFDIYNATEEELMDYNNNESLSCTYPFSKFDGTALMATGIIAQEMMRESMLLSQTLKESTQRNSFCEEMDEFD